MADAREVMNIRQASQYLGVSPDTLYKYVSEERIPAFKLGNRWKFKKSILDTWMENQSLNSEDLPPSQTHPHLSRRGVILNCHRQLTADIWQLLFVTPLSVCSPDPPSPPATPEYRTLPARLPPATRSRQRK